MKRALQKKYIFFLQQMLEHPKSYEPEKLNE